MAKPGGTPPTPPRRTTPYPHHRKGPKYQKWRDSVYTMWGRTCHLCGHEGADSIDHLTPLSVWPDQPLDPLLSRPAHGIKGCPVCKVKCNQARGTAIMKPNYEGPVQW